MRRRVAPCSAPDENTGVVTARSRGVDRLLNCDFFVLLADAARHRVSPIVPIRSFAADGPPWRHSRRGQAGLRRGIRTTL
jgi:hypothetical protein